MNQSRVSFSPSRLALLGILAALTLTIIEGAIRKWVIGTDTTVESYFIYFSKDIVFFALLLLPVKKKGMTAFREFRRWLVPGCFLLISGAIGSSIIAINPVGSILTFRAAVLLPLVACLVLRRAKGISLRHVAMLLALFTFVNFVLGVFQNKLPADNVLNRYAAITTDITVLDVGVRATGTFSYIAGMGVISLVGVWAGIILLSIGNNQWERIAGWLSVVSGFGCGLTSISRSPVWLGALMVAVWGIYFRFGISKGFRIIFAGSALLGLVVFFNLTPIFSDLGQGLLTRQETAGDTFTGRTLGQFQEGYEAIFNWPFGNGFGTEQIGGNYYSTGTMSFRTYETQLPRIIIETGILGLAGFLMICTGAILTLQLAKRDASTKAERSILITTQLLLLSIFFTNIIFNHTASAFAWLIFVAVAAGRFAPAAPPIQQNPIERNRPGRQAGYTLPSYRMKARAPR